MAAGDKKIRSVCLEAGECESTHGVVSVYACARVFVECVTEALQDKGKSGLEPSEEINDELGRARRWMQQNLIIC